MKWQAIDLKQYVQAKEYVDTLVIPLIPYQLTNEKKIIEQSFQGELITIFASEIERELTGRVLLTPPYVYLPTTDKQLEIDRLNEWVKDAEEQPFNHIVFFTFDSEWNKHEEELAGNLISILSMRSGDIHSKEMKLLIRDQVAQIVEMIQEKWKEQ